MKFDIGDFDDYDEHDCFAGWDEDEPLVSLKPITPIVDNSPKEKREEKKSDGWCSAISAVICGFLGI